MVPSILDTKNGSSKKIESEDFGVYEGPEAQQRLNLDQESPFSLANEARSPSNKLASEVKKTKSTMEGRESEGFLVPVNKTYSEVPAKGMSNERIDKSKQSKKKAVDYSNDKERRDYKDYLTTTEKDGGKKQKQGDKRVSSAGNTPLKQHKKSKKKKTLKELKKLRSNARSGSVMRKYSIDQFKEHKGEKGAGNSIERLKQNLAKFKENTIFKKGSDSERSLRSRDSRISS